MTGYCASPAERVWLEHLLASAAEVGGVEMALAEVRERLRQPDLLAHWRRWFAPLAGLEGCWLERVVTIANAHTPMGAALLELQRTFREWRPPVAAKGGDGSGELRREREWLTAFAALGEHFVPEVVGLTQAHVELDGGLFALGKASDHCQVRDALTRVLAFWPGAGPQRRRVEAARNLYRQRTLAWCRWWLVEAEVETRVLSLLRCKAKYGRGYHRTIQLGGRALDDWLAELATGGGEGFASALLASPYVDRDHPGASRLLRATAFGGPMFGVFTAEERQIVLAWLKTQRPSGGGASRRSEIASPLPPRPAVASPPSAAREKRLPPALLYHRLLNSRQCPTALPAARKLVTRTLARARRRRKGFFPWSPEAFCDYLDRLHEAAYRGDNGPWGWLSPAACRWGIEQLAPAILVDGCWLQYSLQLMRELPEVGEPLWRIYRDELGDGVVAHHHGNVYRRLLAEAGIALPPLTSEDFIRHPGFIAAAFDLPAFLLAIDSLAQDFLPEILGLNLAIELSGLGRVYQRLAATLEAHGFDATIVRLHQSIDNLACGHAALARESVIAYLERFGPGGENAVEAQWRRVWSGWQAFGVASQRFVRQLVGGWLWRFAVVERCAGSRWLV